MVAMQITEFGIKDVYCDIGWIIVMRRYNSTMDFHRNWAEYKNGFGDPRDQFWMGNEALHALTNQGNYSMQIDMLSCNGNSYYVRWDLFRIENETQKYAVEAISVESHNVSSDTKLMELYGREFGTYDVPIANCSQDRGGGWWWGSCGHDHITAFYPECNMTSNQRQRMKFSPITGRNCDRGCLLQAATMKIRRNV
ncbi:angiopoietin-1 [Lingula anatina]|uniref:Angiopoietin-1 n=1 Tax=Lingula anatina TaxID=7574 RepID=A0A1S3HQ60_LINAN|nr:angiopoietin-1 [Lingula anatina]|eukprot:XP_013387676.1 angiopoietin-1 [Lingula anatina]